MTDIATAFSTKINHIHVKEAVGFGVEEFVRFGEGLTDKNSFIETMLDIGYSGYISVELAILDKSHVVEDLRTAYEKFHRCKTL